jgi:hypothetical protein
MPLRLIEPSCIGTRSRINVRRQNSHGFAFAWPRTRYDPVPIRSLLKTMTRRTVESCPRAPLAPGFLADGDALAHGDSGSIRPFATRSLARGR